MVDTWTTSTHPKPARYYTEGVSDSFRVISLNLFHVPLWATFGGGWYSTVFGMALVEYEAKDGAQQPEQGLLPIIQSNGAFDIAGEAFTLCDSEQDAIAAVRPSEERRNTQP